MIITLLALRVISTLLLFVVSQPPRGFAIGASAPSPPSISDRAPASRLWLESESLQIPQSFVHLSNHGPDRPDPSADPESNVTRWLALLLNPEVVTQEREFDRGQGVSREPVLHPEILIRLDRYLHYRSAKLSEDALHCGDPRRDSLNGLITALDQRRQAEYPAGPEPTLSTANAALAEFADCGRPALIVLMADSVLERYAEGPEQNSTLAVMTLADLPAAVVLSDLLARKAVRAGVPLDALALKSLRSELLSPVLAQPGAVTVTLRACPAWRSHLLAVTSLSNWHSYDALIAFAAHAARSAAGEFGRERSDGSVETSVERVVGVIETVLAWWRQPPAARVLRSVPESDLWSSFVRTRGNSAAAARLPEPPPSSRASQQSLQDLISSGELAPLEPRALRHADVVAFPHATKLALARAGCLGAEARTPAGPLSWLLRATPGCGALRAFMRTPEGRTGYLRHLSGYTGVWGRLLRTSARIALALRTLRDCTLHGTAGVVKAARAGWAAAARPRSPESVIASSVPPRTVFDWIANTDPYTVFGTSLAAMLAVLRVLVRLRSAFSATAGGGAQPVVESSARPLSTVSVTSDDSQQSSAAPGSRKAGRRTKSRQKLANSRSSNLSRTALTGSGRLLEASARGPPSPCGTAALPRGESMAAAVCSTTIFDPIALRFRPLMPVPPPPPQAAPRPNVPYTAPAATSRRSGASAGNTEHLAPVAPSQPPHNPTVAQAIASVLPPMMRVRPPSGEQDGSEEGGLSGRHSAALAQLHGLHALRVTAFGKDAPSGPLVIKLPSLETVHSSSGVKGGRGASGACAGARTAEELSSMQLDMQSEDSCSGNVSNVDIIGAHASSGNADAPSRDGSGVTSAAATPPPPNAAAVCGQHTQQLQAFRREECGDVPELFLCPISRELMEWPVLAPDGHVYERTQIESWLRDHCTSPMTNSVMEGDLLPVLSLRSEIQNFMQRFPNLR